MTEKKQTFSANERLKSRKEISRIFKDGIFLYSDNFSLGFLRKINQNTHKIAVSVPKKFFKSAVIRNKLKRRIKESYRLNKQLLYGISEESAVFCNLIIIYKNKKILPFQEINLELTELLKKLKMQS